MRPCPCPCPDLCPTGESAAPDPVYPPIPVGANASYRSHLGNVCSILPPTNIASFNTDDGAWEHDSLHTLRFYSFKTVNGVRFYSDTYTEASAYYDIGARYWTWDLPEGAEGVRVLHATDDSAHPMAFDYYTDTGGAVPDDFHWDRWTAGNTVTPNTATPGAADEVGLYLLRWEDQTGNLKHLLQSTVANRPLHSALKFGGYPGVRFDGVNDKMQIAATFAAQNNFTIIAVLRCEAISRSLVNLGGTTDFLRTTTQFGLRAPGLIFSIPNPPVDPTTTVVVTCVRSGSTGTLRVNGVTRATGNIGSQTWNNIGLLTNLISNSGSLVDWAALDIWNSALTLPEILVQEAYHFAAYYNAKSLPTGLQLNTRIIPDDTTRETPAGETRVVYFAPPFVGLRGTPEGDSRTTPTGDARLI
jgi:hypothetical protein